MGNNTNQPTTRSGKNAPSPAPSVPVTDDLMEVENRPDPKHFFKTEDWWAALGTFVLATAVFWHHMAPEVTLQDSGELVTGAFTFGVPHPPGYPLWAFLGFIWSHFIVPFGNPAWRIGLMSVFTGGLTVGVMTLMMTRSTRVLLHALPWSEAIEEKTLHWIALMVAISTSLLFGFNRGVWLWACVSEMRVLNVFSFVLMACTFFAWTIQPQRKGFLYATLLIFGLSMTNHQTVTVMAGALVVGTFAVGLDHFIHQRRTIPEADRPGDFTLFMRSFDTSIELTIAVLFSLSAAFYLFAWLREDARMSLTAQPDFAKTMGLLVGGIVVMAVSRSFGWIKIRRAMLYTGLFLSGCAFYLYMPIASQTNPPMNWGYAGTKEGFLHSITRGQYEKLSIADLFNPIFLTKIKVFILGLAHQYTWTLFAIGLITIIVAVVWLLMKARQPIWMLVVWGASFLLMLVGLGAFRVLLGQTVESIWPAILWAASLATILCALISLWFYLRWPGGSWMIFVWTAFLVTSLGLLTIINPKLDRQEQEITIKFFAPAHGFYAMLIGYGIALIFAFVMWIWKGVPRVVIYVCAALLLLLPLITYRQNLSLCALGTHDFGYQFGYRMFKPGAPYPDMEQDAVLYGGTDPGRFVPTYMIFCESFVAPKDRFHDKTFDRRDVYIITQNALADNTYMSYIRDHYDYSRPTNNTPLKHWLDREHTFPKNPIYIPNPDESAQAFKQFVDDVQAGRIPAAGNVEIKDGRVSVTGVQAVMAINGILAKWIFDKNKDKHAFYVEESYVIPWMYPYLRPAGVIMKIEKEPLPSPQENAALWKDIVAKDKLYWDTLTREFTNREEFVRNNDAKKSFSKMRSAIAGLYQFRGMADEAIYAYKQSLDLCPESPEGCFRLADLYMQQHRYDDARLLMENYLKLDEYNDNVINFLHQLTDMSKMDTRRRELEESVKKGANITAIMELLTVYGKLNQGNEFSGLAMNMLNATNLPPAVYLQLAQVCGNARQPNIALEAVKRYLAHDARNSAVWIEQGLLQFTIGQNNEGMASLRKAVEVGGEAARNALRNDARFEPLRNQPAFQSLIQAQPTVFNMSNGGLGMP